MDKWFLFGKSEEFDTALRKFNCGDFAEAAAGFELCLGLRIDSGLMKLSRQYLTHCLVKMTELDSNPLEHVTLLQRAVAVEPQYADLQFRLGAALYEIKDFGGAQEAIDRALDINPEYWKAHALKLRISGKSPGELLERWNLLHPSDPVTTLEELESLQEHGASVDQPLRAALAALDADDAEDAIDLLLPLTQQYPHYADLRLHLGRAFMANDELDLAQESLEQALYINPRYADARATLGILFARMGEGDRSRQAFRATLEIDPHHPVASAELSRIR